MGFGRVKANLLARVAMAFFEELRIEVLLTGVYISISVEVCDILYDCVLHLSCPLSPETLAQIKIVCTCGTMK